MIKIVKAEKHHAPAIARLVMMAMSQECCQNLAGPDHTLAEFEAVMIDLAAMERSQYSYLNTLVAVDDRGTVIGACVSYDGARLHELRQAFVWAARRAFGIDYSKMADEAQPDELYVDSLAVVPAYRRQGVAGRLLQAVVQQAAERGVEKVGLLVDKNNPRAESLYSAQGFVYVGDAAWGGHAMRHLQRRVSAPVGGTTGC